MKTIKVSTDSINGAWKKASEEVEGLSAALVSMRKSVDALNATWEGGNHDEFVATFSERYERMEKCVELLKGYLEAVGSASKSYEDCESDVSGLAAF